MSIKNRFDNAVRVKELDPRYGRVQGIIGTLNVSSKRPRVFSSHDRRTLMQLGYQASIAIRNARPTALYAASAV